MRAFLLLALLALPAGADDPSPAPEPTAPFSNSQVQLNARELAAIDKKGWVANGGGFADSEGKPITWKKMSGLIRKETSHAISELKQKRKDGALTDQDLEQARRLFYTRLPFFPEEEKREKVEHFLESLASSHLPKSPAGLGGVPGDDTDGEPPSIAGNGTGGGRTSNPWDGGPGSAGGGVIQLVAPPAPAAVAAPEEADAPAADGGSSGWSCGRGNSSPSPSPTAPATTPAQRSRFPGLWAIAAAPAALERLRRRRERIFRA